MNVGLATAAGRCFPALAVMLAMGSSCRSPVGEDVRIRAAARTSNLAASWEIPGIDPCAMLSRSEVAALLGSPVGEPRPGGTAVDGSACQYRGRGPFVITLGAMSTNAYESLKVDFGGDPVPDIGAGALVAGPDSLGDVTLVARDPGAAVLVMVSGVIPGDVGPARRTLAAEIARQALAGLNHTPVALRPGRWPR